MRCFPACTLIVPVIYCYTTGPVKMPSKPRRPQLMGHRNNMVASLTCGSVGMATRAPQPSRHNRHSDCSPSGSNYPYISKECWPLCEPRFILLRVLPSAQWGRPPTFSTPNLQRDRHTDRHREREREREDPLSQERLSKNIRSHCPIFCFTPKLTGSGCSRSKSFPPDLHMRLTVL